MLVCHCNGVSDRAIRKAVRRGAATANDVGHMTGAGTCCGGCIEAVKQIVHAESGGRDELPVVSVPAPSAQAVA